MEKRHVTVHAMICKSDCDRDDKLQNALLEKYTLQGLQAGVELSINCTMMVTGGGCLMICSGKGVRLSEHRVYGQHKEFLSTDSLDELETAVQAFADRLREQTKA